jgi:CheY-like chemotaxis protein
MNGWAVLTALSADPALATIPVIMLTITDDQKQGFALGATEFLTKPIDTTHLVSVLRRYSHGNTSNLALVVEDDAGLRELMRRQLHKAGWEVAEAENGQMALARLAKMQPTVILMDLMMPEMDGFLLLNELRQTDTWRSIPVIVVTAKELTPDDRQRLDSAVAAILHKGEGTCETLLQQLRQLVPAHA